MRNAFVLFVQTSLVVVCAVVVGSCASKVLKHSDANRLEFSKDFDRMVKIEDIKPEEVSKAPPPLPAPEPPPVKSKRGKKAKKAKKPVAVTPAKPEVKGPEKRQPVLEDAEKMVGRRPLVEPFRIGEKVTLALSYFGMAAGEMTMEMAPFVEVNGRKAYHFKFGAKSSSVFSVFYAVDDTAETFLDYADLIPSTYAIHVKESKQLREVRAFWDYPNKQANVWDKKVTKEKGVQEDNQQWELQPYAQNVFSAVYYMRIFQMYPGKKLAFYVADSGKNYLFRGEVLRREKLKTDIGELDTLVIKPKFELDGLFAPVGDILFWLTDDDRKFLVRIESKIKIGTIVGQITALEKGKP